jgi:hypothetical protein
MNTDQPSAEMTAWERGPPQSYQSPVWTNQPPPATPNQFLLGLAGCTKVRRNVVQKKILDKVEKRRQLGVSMKKMEESIQNSVLKYNALCQQAQELDVEVKALQAQMFNNTVDG